MSTKTIGAVVVLEFALRCVQQGATVSEPIGDDSPYDLLVDTGTHIFRVQVKGATENKKRPGFFLVNTQRRVVTVSDKTGKLTSKAVPYKSGEIDCIVTKAGSSWFFFKNPHELPAGVEINPSNASDSSKWNNAKDDWSVVGLASNLGAERAAPAES